MISNEELQTSDQSVSSPTHTGPLNRSFFARFNKIISLAYGAITISAAVLFSFLYSDNYEATLQSTKLRLLEQTRAFDGVLRIRYDAVKAMQRQARKFLQHEFLLFDTNLKLKNIPSKNIYFLSIQSGEDENYGIIVGEGNVNHLSEDVRRELQMAYSLTPLVSVLKKQIQSVVSFKYTSSNHFYFSYPWYDDQEITFNSDIYKQEYYLRSIPENNREDKVFWTDVFLSENHDQPLITCAAPVYNNRDYVGVVAIDFTLDFLDFFLENIYLKYGQFMIVNDFNTVLADMGTQTFSQETQEKFSNSIPKNLKLDLSKFHKEEDLTLVGDYWVYVASTSFAPWKIVYYVKNDEITFETLKQIFPGLFMVLLFTTLFLIAANRLIAREFIEPTKILIEHILSNGGIDYQSYPSIKPPWTLWFEAVSSVFDENKTLVDKLEKHIHKLDEKVAQRTKDLSRNNRQLKKALDDLKKAQNQIITQEKLAGLGALTAGIAHEIRNPLNFIINFAETSKIFGDEIKEAVDEALKDISPEARKNLEELVQQLSRNMLKIEEHGRRADAIVHSMLMHARGGEDQLQEINLHELLEENILLGLASFKQKGFVPKVTREFDPNLLEVTVYAQNLGRVFLNIINNACYALYEKAKNDLDFTPELMIQTLDHKSMFEVRIKDNGPGIPPHVRKKIFNPFFTTKPSGEGTGLGLSLCFDIVVNQHHGHFELETQEGQFSEFILTLPKVTKKVIESS